MNPDITKQGKCYVVTMTGGAGATVTRYIPS